MASKASVYTDAIFPARLRAETEKCSLVLTAPNPANGTRCAPFFKPLPRLLLPSGKLYFVRIISLLVVVGDAFRSIPVDAE